MAKKSSVWDQPVAGLFSAPVDERNRRARPILRQTRLLLLNGKQRQLLDALHEAAGDDLCGREYARWALRMGSVPSLELGLIDLYGDLNLKLWVLDRALVRAGVVHRGGYHVSSGPLRLAREAA